MRKTLVLACHWFEPTENFDKINNFVISKINDLQNFLVLFQIKKQIYKVGNKDVLHSLGGPQIFLTLTIILGLEMVQFEFTNYIWPNFIPLNHQY